MSRPAVSIVMAAYNVGPSLILDGAITSLIRQDLADWELLICDDASTDGTYERLLEWEQTDKRIRVFRNEVNRKAAATRNRCIENTLGTYIAIMDADDLCSANRLRMQMDFLENNPQISFVGLKGERFCCEPGDTNNPYWFVKEPQKEDFLMTLPFVHASLMFRREDLLSVGCYKESSSVERSEDYDLLLRLYAAGKRGVNLRNGVYYIRENVQAVKRRKYRYRWKEVWVKWTGFWAVGMMPRAIPYALKPMVVGLIPQGILNKAKHRYYSRRSD